MAAAVHPASAGRLGAERADAGHPAHAVATALPLRLLTRGELHSHSVSKPGGAIGLPRGPRWCRRPTWSDGRLSDSFRCRIGFFPSPHGLAGTRAQSGPATGAVCSSHVPFP